MMSIEIDYAQHFEHAKQYAVAFIVAVWLLTKYGSAALAKLREVFQPAKVRDQLAKLTGGGAGWLVAILAVLAFWPAGAIGPSPGPGPDPVPPAAADLFSRQTEIYRVLLADLLAEFAGRPSTQDSAASKWLEEHIAAARSAAMGPIDDAVAKATFAGPEFTQKLADNLRAGKLEPTE